MLFIFFQVGKSMILSDKTDKKCSLLSVLNDPSSKVKGETKSDLVTIVASNCVDAQKFLIRMLLIANFFFCNSGDQDETKSASYT